MKLSEVEVGGRYLAKVSGKVQVVRIAEITKVPGWSGLSKKYNERTRIHAVNEATGRRIMIRSPQRLRPLLRVTGQRAGKTSDALEPATAADPEIVDEAKAAQSANDWPRAATLWRRVAETCDAPQRRERYLKQAAWCDDMAVLAKEATDQA